MILEYIHVVCACMGTARGGGMATHRGEAWVKPNKAFHKAKMVPHKEKRNNKASHGDKATHEEKNVAKRSPRG